MLRNVRQRGGCSRSRVDITALSQRSGQLHDKQRIPQCERKHMIQQHAVDWVVAQDRTYKLVALRPGEAWQPHVCAYALVHGGIESAQKLTLCIQSFLAARGDDDPSPVAGQMCQIPEQLQAQRIDRVEVSHCQHDRAFSGQVCQQADNCGHEMTVAGWTMRRLDCQSVQQRANQTQRIRSHRVSRGRVMERWRTVS